MRNGHGAQPFDARHFAFCVAGIYASFLLWGWLQERLTTKTYGEAAERFTFITFLNLVQYSFACAVARGAIAAGLGEASAQAEGWALHGPVTRIALTNTLGSLVGYASLEYISFPLHVLAKSCKLIPVMAMGFIVNGQRYSGLEITSVLSITLGLCLFMSKPGGHDDDGERRSELIGVALVFANLSLDGVTNAMQDRLNHRHGPSPHELMWLLNLWSVLLLLPAAFFVLPPPLAELADGHGLPAVGGGWEAIAFLERQPEARWDMLLFCAAGAVGQNFIFISLKAYGSLVNVSITITRKFLTIFLSNLAFGHRLGALQWGGCVLVFGGLLARPLLAPATPDALAAPTKGKKAKKAD